MRRAAFYVVLALAAVTFLYPFLWMAATTFKSPAEVGGLSLLPDQPTLDNYRLMWARAPFGRALLNSLLVATRSQHIRTHRSANTEFEKSPLLPADPSPPSKFSSDAEFLGKYFEGLCRSILTLGCPKLHLSLRLGLFDQFLIIPCLRAFHF